MVVGLNSLANNVLGQLPQFLQAIPQLGSQGSRSNATVPVFERAYARLVPFDLPLLMRNATPSHALYPIIQTGGLVFPFVPNVAEGISVKYNSMEMVHSNEAYHVYQATENVHITLSNCVWTCDTFANAVYALSVLHFLRSYSMMDFGRATKGNIRGRPPSPMWFSAFGTYAFHKVPVLLQRADWTFPDDQDYVGVPEPGSESWNTCQLVTEGQSGAVTWLPMKFTVSSISLIVQHAPRYWINWNLDDYRSGKMLERTPNRSFHDILPPTIDNTAPDTSLDGPSSENGGFDENGNPVGGAEGAGAGAGGGSVTPDPNGQGGVSVSRPLTEADMEAIRKYQAGDPSVSSASLTREQKIIIARDFYMSKGMDEAHANAVVGNLLGESQLRTTAVNPKDGRDGSDSIGIMQWNSSRAVGLKNFAANNGGNPYDLTTQLNYTWHERNTTEKAGWDAFLAAPDQRTATQVFMQKIERPQQTSFSTERDNYARLAQSVATQSKSVSRTQTAQLITAN